MVRQLICSNFCSMKYWVLFYFRQIKLILIDCRVPTLSKNFSFAISHYCYTFIVLITMRLLLQKFGLEFNMFHVLGPNGLKWVSRPQTPRWRNYLIFDKFIGHLMILVKYGHWFLYVSRSEQIFVLTCTFSFQNSSMSNTFGCKFVHAKFSKR